MGIAFGSAMIELKGTYIVDEDFFEIEILGEASELDVIQLELEKC